MVELGCVEKNARFYSLTLKRKKFANHIHTKKNKVVKFRKVSVSLYCIREIKGVGQCLIYTRLKHPFFGKQGFPTGKVESGEKFDDVARRELKEETNLTCEPAF